MQITSARNLRIMGERQISENHLSRFRKEFPISSNHDTHRIRARFDNGILYIKHPKMIIPAEPQAGKDEEAKPKPTAETQKPPKPKPKPQQAERSEQNKEVKESPKPLEPSRKPELQQHEKTGQKKETREYPEPSEPKPEPQPRKAEKQKGHDQIPPKTGAEKPPVEKTNGKVDPATKKLPGKEQKLGEIGGEIAQSSVPADGKDASTAFQRRKKPEEEKKPSELVHGGDRRPRTGDGSGSSGREMKTYQKNIGDIIVKLKKYGNIINLVVAGLLVLVLALYIKYTIISRGTTQLGSLEGQED